MHGGPAWLAAAADPIRRQAADLVAAHDLPGAVVGVVTGGDLDAALAWSAAFGPGGGPARPDASRPDGQPLDADTLFRVASITKTFTATALVQLRDAGRLHLDDPLVQHLPEFRAVVNPFGRIEDVTLRRVAAHAGGLVGEPPTDHWVTLRFPTRDAWLAALPQVRVAIPPGSAFKYSNLGYTLLGEVVRRVSGRPYAKYVHERILRPLRMRSSTFDLTDRLGPRAAAGHLPHPFEDEAAPAPPSPLVGMAAAGQLWTTARDLSRWLAFHLGVDPDTGGVPAARITPDVLTTVDASGARVGLSGADVLAAASRAEMQRAVFVEPNWTGGYGLGWRIIRRGERIYHGHGGSVPGYRSQILFCAALAAGIVVLIDGVGPADAIAAELLDALAEQIQHSEPRRPAAPPPPTPPVYRPFLGVYRMIHFADVVRVEFRGGRLLLLNAPGSPVPDAPPTVLEPTGQPGAFLVRGGRYSGERLTFSRADGGRVSGLRAGGFAFARLDPVSDLG